MNLTLDDNHLIIDESGSQTLVFGEPDRLAWFVEQLASRPEPADGDESELPVGLHTLRSEGSRDIET